MVRAGRQWAAICCIHRVVAGNNGAAKTGVLAQPKVCSGTYVPGFWSVKGLRETVRTLMVSGLQFRLLWEELEGGGSEGRGGVAAAGRMVAAK